ncbi:hypothetical protein FHL01_06515 [Cylindrospermopsis raciborskii CS-506_C]|uniref:hypothetical protein n=1 Tax=Cylindrospermopsis raciborskii TaxID=77022 RepID=UPI0015A54A8A|nr:hypothetical protein [Cylindrospermopsis raciborskii]MBA4445188.1 hypothetical protein [Cylindrospermopsis raciborskii CS-506_C]MBA4456047.1 hypothetical protein [Cylindrospermopsis raciborskii CS-506_B]
MEPEPTQFLRNGTWGIPPSELDNWWAGLIGHHIMENQVIKRLRSTRTGEIAP